MSLCALSKPERMRDTISALAGDAIMLMAAVIINNLPIIT